MTEAVDLERLMVQLEANSTKLERDFRRAESIINDSTDRMELRLAKMKAKMEKGFSSLGTNAASNFTKALLAGLSVAAVEEFVRRTTDTVENIAKQSRALGVSTDFYQGISISAEKTGVAQDELNAALDNFSKNVGLAQLKTTPFGQAMKRLGVDVKAGPEQAFYGFIDAVNKVGNVQQRNAVISLGMGKASVGMAALITQGTDAIKQQMAAAKQNGEIIDHEGIEKIEALGRA